jgi:hypothetical protein
MAVSLQRLESKKPPNEKLTSASGLEHSAMNCVTITIVVVVASTTITVNVARQEHS